MSRYLIMPSPAQLGTQIVTSGLVGHWDAGNSASYPGSGTTWTDLSGSNRTGTLTNGPTYSTSHGGAISFDGTNDHVLVTGSNTVSAATFVAWVRRNGNQVNYCGVMTSRPSTFDGNPGQDVNGMVLYLTTNNLGYIWEAQTNTYQWNSGLTVPNNTWCMIAVSVGASSATAYIRGVGIQSSATNNVSHASTTIGRLVLGCDQVGAAEYRSWNGDIGAFMYYDRALSASEITQLYDATRGRFGL